MGSVAVDMIVRGVFVGFVIVDRVLRLGVRFAVAGGGSGDTGGIRTLVWL